MKINKARLTAYVTLISCIVLYHIFASNRAFANFFAESTLPIRKALGSFCGLFPFSAAELVMLIAAILFLLWVIRTICLLVSHSEPRSDILRRRAAVLLIPVLSIYLILCLFLGASLSADGFSEHSGLIPQPTSVEALRRTTAVFAEKLSETADLVSRDSDGCMNTTLDEIFDHSTEIYRRVDEMFPFLALRDTTPKRFFCSRLMSLINFTGFYFPFLGEANINVDMPVCMVPSTIAHELAHQRGVASEQECNFLAVLSSVTSGNDIYEYGGWLFGYIHLSNALYRYDYDAYCEISAILPAEIWADFAVNNEYWDQFQRKPAAKAVSQVSEKVYDSMLKSYGLESGIQSYGEVVDLLILWNDLYGF